MRVTHRLPIDLQETVNDLRKNAALSGYFQRTRNSKGEHVG
jgi:hypothetical protein